MPVIIGLIDSKNHWVVQWTVARSVIGWPLGSLGCRLGPLVQACEQIRRLSSTTNVLKSFPQHDVNISHRCQQQRFCITECSKIYCRATLWPPITTLWSRDKMSFVGWTFTCDAGESIRSLHRQASRLWNHQRGLYLWWLRLNTACRKSGASKLCHYWAILMADSRLRCYQARSNAWTYLNRSARMWSVMPWNVCGGSDVIDPALSHGEIRPSFAGVLCST